MKYIRALLVFLCVSIYQPYPVHAFTPAVKSVLGLSSGATSYRILYSGFDSTEEDAIWTGIPPGWDANYATSPAPLAGVHSLVSDIGTDTIYSNTFTTVSSGVLYARVYFRIKDSGTTNDEMIKVGFRNTANDAWAAVCGINYSTAAEGVYDIYGEDSISSTSQTALNNLPLNDATYIIWITYSIGSQISCSITDTSSNVVDELTVDYNTSGATPTNRFGIGNRAFGGTAIFDTVEVRSDEMWGTP